MLGNLCPGMAIKFNAKDNYSIIYINICIYYLGSMYVSGKLPTYLSPNLTFCLKREVSVNVRFWER